MAQLPLASSKQVLAVLEREGFAKSGVARGSHRVMKKRTPTGTLMEPVPLDRREIPRGTLTSILRRAGISRTRFLVLLGGRSAQP